MSEGWCGIPLPDTREGWKTRALSFIKLAGEAQAGAEMAEKKAAFWKEATVQMRKRIVDLYDRYDNEAHATYERCFNSILDTEDDPNPEIADDERDRWLVERTWLTAISAVLDQMPTGEAPCHARRGAGNPQTSSPERSEGEPSHIRTEPRGERAMNAPDEMPRRGDYPECYAVKTRVPCGMSSCPSYCLPCHNFRMAWYRWKACQDQTVKTT